jgi:flagellar basal body-associated protein FliL
MNTKNDFFQKKLSNTRSFTKKRHSSSTWIWIVVLFIVLLGGGTAYYYLFYASPNLSTSLDEEPSSFSLGQEVALHGELKADGDIITHTHTVVDTNYGVMAVKSKVVNV